MSRTLCAYPAEQIYTPAYGSATPEIGSRRLLLAKPSDAATSWPTPWSTPTTRW